VRRAGRRIGLAQNEDARFAMSHGQPGDEFRRRASSPDSVYGGQRAGMTNLCVYRPRVTAE
jgi:hypothetical protein